jgi:mannose-6-phosphate isomerase
MEPASAGLGKTEAWVILKAENDSLVYAGLRSGVSKAEFQNALTKGKLPDVMHSYVPRLGDCIFLEAGTVHAIGAGLMLFEVQQTSDITYRLYDWGRVDAKTGKPRALHIEQALNCTNYERGPCDPVKPSPISGNKGERLVSCGYFTLDRVRSEQAFSVGVKDHCRIIVCIEGKGRLVDRGKSYSLKTGDVLLLPASIGVCECVPDSAMTILECGTP